jgi:hypothetical protein
VHSLRIHVVDCVSYHEWLELFNPTSAPVDLAGWALRDNSEQDAIAAFILAPGEYLVIAATSAGFFANYPGFTGNLVVLKDSIGNGLGNAGDWVILLDPAGAQVDAMSYGSDASVFNPPCPLEMAASRTYMLARASSASSKSRFSLRDGGAAQAYRKALLQASRKLTARQ